MQVDTPASQAPQNQVSTRNTIKFQEQCEKTYTFLNTFFVLEKVPGISKFESTIRKPTAIAEVLQF